MRYFPIAPFVVLIACSPGSPGQAGNADFAYEDLKCLLDCSVAKNDVASGGARVGIAVKVKQGVPPLADVKSSDETVAKFARAVQSSDVEMTSAAAGSAWLIVLDANGKEIDRALTTVKKTTVLSIATPWAPSPGPTVLAGTVDGLSATTKAGDETTVGTGAVKFTLGGTVAPGGGITLFDSVSFKAEAKGEGTIALDADDAHLVVPVTVVAPADITWVALSPQALSFAHGKSASVAAMFRAGPEPVFGADCQWSSAPAGLTLSAEGGGTVGSTPARSYLVSSTAAGNYTATCTPPAGQPQTLAVTVN